MVREEIPCCATAHSFLVVCSKICFNVRTILIVRFEALHSVEVEGKREFVKNRVLEEMLALRTSDEMSLNVWSIVL